MFSLPREWVIRREGHLPALRNGRGVRRPTPQAFDWPFAECKLFRLASRAAGVHGGCLKARGSAHWVGVMVVVEDDDDCWGFS